MIWDQGTPLGEPQRKPRATPTKNIYSERQNPKLDVHP